MKLLTTIAVSNHDAAHAERLLDHIHHQSGKRGHLLLAIQSNVHDEMKARLRISASLAFDVVHEMETRPLADVAAPKVAQTNSVFRQVAEWIQTRIGWPYLWLESDCTPTVSNWRERLFAAYDDQPMRYFGNRMKIKPKTEGAPEVLFMARVGIYPPDAFGDMIPAELFVPVEIASANLIQPRMAATKLFQTVNIATEDDLISVREDALLVHGDKHGYLMKSLADQEPKPEPIKIEATTTTPPLEPPRITRRMQREMNGARS